MGMTITEKILASHAGLDAVQPGELIDAHIDVALGNDITAPISIDLFKKSGAKKVFDRERVVLVLDHFVPTKDIQSAAQCKIVRDFAREHDIVNFFESSNAGIEHALLPEKGLVLPGDLIFGADSHTCTYGALGAFSSGGGSTDLAAAMITGKLWFKVPESIKFVFTGALNPWVSGKDLILYTIGDIGGRRSLVQSHGIYRSRHRRARHVGPLDHGQHGHRGRRQKRHFRVRTKPQRRMSPDGAARDYKFIYSDDDAQYSETKTYDASQIEPQVAFPHLPENTRGISEVGEIPINQVIIGSCTNGRIEDLRNAAAVLKGRKAAKDIRLIIIPATPFVYRTALEEGLFETFLDAGAVISPPTCGPCLGGHMGILAKGERAVATTNRNFVGRMGHTQSEVYLSNPAVAAASAVLGKIGGPDQL